MDGHPQPTESFSDLLYLQSISLLTLELRAWTQAQGGPPWPEWLLLGEAELEPRPVNRSSSRMLVPSSAEHHLCHCSERTSSKFLQDFPEGPVVKTLQGVKVRFLVGELRFHVPCGTAKKKKNCYQQESKVERSELSLEATVWGPKPGQAPDHRAPGVLTWVELTLFSREYGLTLAFCEQLRVCSHNCVMVWDVDGGWRFAQWVRGKSRLWIRQLKDWSPALPRSVIWSLFKKFVFIFLGGYRAAWRILVPWPGIEPSALQWKQSPTTGHQGSPSDQQSCFLGSKGV